MKRFKHIKFLKNVSIKQHLYTLGGIIGWVLFIRQIHFSFVALRSSDIHLYFPHLAYFIFSIVACLSFYFIQMLSWTFVMKFLGVSIKLSDTIKGYTISFLPRYIPGTVWGYWSRNIWLKQTVGASHVVSIFGSLIEVVAFVFTSIMIITYGLRGLWVRSIVNTIFIVLITFWLFLGSFLIKKNKTYLKEHLLKYYITWIGILGIYLIFWVFYGLAVVFIISDLDWKIIKISIFSTTSAWLIGFLIVFVPGGLGIREIALTHLLNLTMNIPLFQANLISIAFRITNILAEIFWLFVGLVLSYFPKLTLKFRIRSSLNRH